MQPNVRRATAFALVGSIALGTPLVGAVAAVPFALIAVLARFITRGRVFRLLARPSDEGAGQLHGLIRFVLAATALILLTALIDLPVIAAVGAVLLVGYGDAVEQVLCEQTDPPIFHVSGFISGGFLLSFIGIAVVFGGMGDTSGLALIGFYLIVGAFLAATIRVVVGDEEDMLSMFSICGVLWLLASIELSVTAAGVVLAVLVAGSFGYASWFMGTASETGMLTGILMGIITIVLGGWAWFVLLIAFFGIGGIAAKYQIQEKQEYGVAEANQGARGSRNVIGNAMVALLAVIGYAGSAQIGVESSFFLLAFAGSVATAMGDTLSSEIGVLFGPPQLVTTLEEVPRGTDGAVSFEGMIAGVGGAVLVALLGSVLFGIGVLGFLVVLVSGVVGMVADSVLGATIEGRFFGNQSVNFLATLIGALVAGFPVLLGVLP